MNATYWPIVAATVLGTAYFFNTDGLKIQYNEAYGNRGKVGIDRGGFDADNHCINPFI